MILKKDIEQNLKEFWPDNWERIIEHYQKQANVLRSVGKKIDNNYVEKCILERIKGREDVLKYEQDVLKKIIPKDKLEDGVTYIGTGCSLSRNVEEARWDIKERQGEHKGMFWYTRHKFGNTFEDTMHHFADVVNSSIAGFTPLKKK